MTILVLTLAFSTTCFAKNSPSPTVITTEPITLEPISDESTSDDSTEKVTLEPISDEKNTPNNSGTSPKTGVDAATTGMQAMVPFVVLITAAGVMLIAKKGFSKAN